MDADNIKLLRLLGGTEPKGVAPPRPRSPRSRSGGGVAPGGHPNDRAVLTCQPEGGAPLVATTDPFDRAHKVPDARGGVAPACRVLGRRGSRLLVGQTLQGSRPRLYPPSQVVAGPLGPVGIDSAFDAAYERACRLVEEVGDVAGAAGYAHAGVTRMASQDRTLASAASSRPEFARSIARSKRSYW